MEVEEHSASAGDMQAAPSAVVTPIVETVDRSHNSGTESVAVDNAAATEDASALENSESMRSSEESDQAMTSPSNAADSEQIAATGRNNVSQPITVTESNNVSEPEVEAIEMLVMDREAADINANEDDEETDEHDPLISSDIEDDEEDEQDAEIEQEEEDQEEDQMQEFAVDMVFNMIHREAEAGAVERRVNERLHSQINALRSDAVGNRERFHYPIRSQQLLQIRRALLVIDSTRRLRSNQRQQNATDAAGGTADEGGDGPPLAISIEDDQMGDQADNEPQPVVEDAVEPENAIRFDTNLAAEHTYLGTNMNRVSGVEYLDVGGEYNMMLFLHQHIVYPGEVLPFMISGSIIDADIDSANGMLIGICFPFMRYKKDEHSIYGVTCQIYEKGTDVRGHTLIKSRALQRFVTTSDTQTEHLEFINDNPRLKHGHVRILPEIYMREPLKCINMGSMNRFRDIASMEQQFKRFQAATTSWPPHVYDYYNITAIVEKARKSLAQHEIETMPTDPIQLSFWLARNLHLSEELMKNIFMNDTVNLRMKLIDSTFKDKSIFVCRICGNRIANCSELFAMSKHGVQTQYCNSAGYIHETNTVYQLLRDAVSYSGAPSSEFSWFPGYKWHIIVCKVCTRHIGWEFKAMEPNLVPKAFFGISSSSVRVSDSTGAPTNPREEIFRNFMRLARREVQ